MLMITVQTIRKYFQTGVLIYFKCNDFSLRAFLSSPADVWLEVFPETKQKLSTDKILLIKSRQCFNLKKIIHIYMCV